MLRLFLFIVLISGLFTGCSKELSIETGLLPETGGIILAFSPVVKRQPMIIGQEYTNAWGEKYTVSTFKYYLHNIALVSEEGKTVPLSAAYHLVDESSVSSKLISIKAPVGDYQKLIFTLGVDSARNVSGAQTGVLDPVNGMFWTWSSGYVMAKLEGSSASSTSPNGNFSYHIGGFKQPNIASKQIVLDVPVANSLSIIKDADITIDINADIDTWFGRLNAIKIAEYPACHSPGELAKKIADNYEGMFSISEIR